MRNFFTKIAQFLLALTACQIIYVLVILMWPYDVLTVKNLKMVTEQVHVGESAIYEIDYCKHIQAEGVVYYELLDTAGTMWNTIKKNAYRVSGCDTVRV